MGTVGGPSPTASLRAYSRQRSRGAWLQGQGQVAGPRGAGPAPAVGGLPSGAERGCAPCSGAPQPAGAVATAPAPPVAQQQPSAGRQHCPTVAGRQDGGRPGSGTAPAVAVWRRRSHSAAAHQWHLLNDSANTSAAAACGLHGLSWTIFASNGGLGRGCSVQA